MMYRNKTASAHQFSMVPRADVPRSAMRMQKTYKTTFDASKLYPMFCEEVLPGDKWNVSMTSFARLATPIFPVMDNLRFDCFFFFVPNRLVWDNWQKFMGEQTDPDDSIDFTIPQVEGIIWAPLSLGDYFGLPTTDQTSDNFNTMSALPFRMYNLIFNEWFRDQNLKDSVPVLRDDGPDDPSNYIVLVRAKRHDYFTSCLPFPQKGEAVSIPLTGTGVGGVYQPGAPVLTANGSQLLSPAVYPMTVSEITTGNVPATNSQLGVGTGGSFARGSVSGGLGLAAGIVPDNLYADLSEATAGTINALRTAFQVQKLLERDARGGTRYTEIIRSHFGVVSPDARLQRPEYLGGGSIAIAINPIAQTSATSADGTDTPQGNLAAIGTGLLRSGFTQAFTEHGYIIGIYNVRADVTYQQGMRRHWSRLTRYDFYFPAFAHLGEQAVLEKEIYTAGSPFIPPNQDFTNDNLVFGYQERWAEYRYLPNEITGIFRSTHPQTIDAWHYAQKFATAPLLNEVFIQDASVGTVQRSLAVGAAAGGQQLIADFFYDCIVVRPIPMYSVPGMVDHF